MSKLSIVGIFIIAAFVIFFFGRKLHWFGTTLRPSGHVVSDTRKVGDFNKLKLDGVFKTIISQDGGPAWVRVEADENLQQTVYLKNEGETLSVGSRSGFTFSRPTKMVVYVNVKDIRSITNNSVGNIETEGVIKADELDFTNNAVGRTTLDLDVKKLNARLNAVGATTLLGAATTVEIDNSSVGKLHAYDLKTDILDISNKAVGAVEVQAQKEISINHSGVGALHYRGPATVKSLKDDGVGKVSKDE